jgi:RNA polymerase sigma factor for flagellar operon FliA
LINAGIIGLIEAVEGFDPSRDNKFITYAEFRVKGAVLSELRSQDFLSRSNRKKARELEETYLRLEQKLGRKAKDEEIAEEMGLSLDELYELKQISAISLVSLEELGYSFREEKERLMSYLVNSKQDVLAMARVKEIEEAIAKAIDELPDKERLVISLYYWDELTMKEIGKVLEITESRVSQIHTQAILHLRGKLKREGLIGD